MEVTVYIDVLWLRTFFVELNVCVFVNLWMKQERSVVRILWMSVLAVSMEVFLFVIAGYGAVFAVGSLMCRGLLLMALFRPKNRGSFLRLFLWSLTATVVAGGILSACQVHLPERYWFAAGSMVCAIGIMVSLIQEERRVRNDGNLHRINLFYGENCVEVTGLHDTGNCLRDPYVHAPVHILASFEARQLGLRPECCRLIPFETVGAPGGLLEVWTIDAMEWTEGKQEHVVIGLAEDTLFPAKDYRLILAAGWKGLS